MHIAERELNRLISYAEGLGATIIWKEKSDEFYQAQFIYPPPTPVIEILIKKRINYIDIILSLLHELGHYVDWLNSGKRPISEVFTKEHNELNMTERRVVYQSEKKAIIEAVKLAEKLDLKYPKMYLIKAEAAYDSWMYRYFVKNGNYPKRKDRLAKDKQLRDKYKELANNA